MPAAGPEIEIRPVRADDAPAVEELLRGLNDDDRYLRWFSPAVDVDEVLRRAVHPEIDSAVGLLAVRGDEVVGHGVLIPLGGGAGEVAFEVAAPWRRHGIAGHLLAALAVAGADLGLREICADVLWANTDMLAVFREHGPHTETRGAGVVRVTIPLLAQPEPAAA